MSSIDVRLIGFINEIRKYAIFLLTSIVLGSLGFYLISPRILSFLQGHLQQKLAFFTITGPFLAHAKLAFFVTLFTLMPAIVLCFWKALAKPFKLGRTSLSWFVICTCLLFYAGAAFCFFITLPFGVKFLLGFQSEQLQPIISISKFVSFLAIFILAFGVIFELPIFMVFAAKVGVLSRGTFEKNRRYAILVISIVAALLTPTPDVVNMLLMGGPLYLLYELGIIILKILKIP